MTLLEIPRRRNVRAIGLSDWHVMAARLAERISYTNTFYDAEPRLDITSPPGEFRGSLDAVISSDVFEHVPPPVERAFAGAFELLRPGGVLVLTVPYSDAAETLEHFPSLATFAIVGLGASHVLVNRRADGRLEVFEDLVFHGGPGLTLEMRLFSLDGIHRCLTNAGFTDIEVLGDDPAHGVIWHGPLGRTIVARRPGRPG
jgi:SAM-dependent methyltransferase